MTRNSSRLRWPLVGICLLLPAPAVAGVIRGTVRASSVQTSHGPDGRGPSSSSPFEHDSDGDAVIYLEDIPKKLEQKLAKGTPAARIVQRNGRFVPRVLPVVAGTTVTFENRDNVYHNAFSPSPAKRFDIGKYAPHETRWVTFDHPGIVELFCDIDPNEMGLVVVVPNHAFTRPNAAGKFALPKLPPGKYRLTVWHPAHPKRTLDVEMPKRGDVVLALRP